MNKSALEMLQDLDLFHEALRHNCMRGVEAAITGTLLDVCFARGRHEYTRLFVHMLALYSKGGRCPPRVRELLEKFICGSRAGEIGTLQTVDCNHEESQKDIHMSGADRTSFTT